jgi:hypothetical protein
MRRILFLLILLILPFNLSYPGNALALWAKTFGTPGMDMGSVAIEEDGDYFLMGTTQPQGGEQKFIISRISASAGIQYTKTLGGANDHFIALPMQDGGFLVSGITKSFGTGIPGKSNILWAKFNASWNQVYGKVFGGTGDESGSAELTNDGGGIIFGDTNSYGGASDKDLLVIKVNSSGNVQWSKVFHYATDDHDSNILEVSGGFVFAATANGGHDILVVKLNSSGGIEWQKLYSGTEAKSVVIHETTGGYLLWGYVQRSGYNDLLVMKINSSGAIQWQKTYSAGGLDLANHGVLENSGGYVLSGNITNLISMTSKMLLMQLNSSGSIVWQKTYAIGSYDGGGLQKTSDGGYLLSGDTSPSLGGNSNVFFLKMDSNFNIVWQRKFGGSGFENGGALEQGGKYYLSGTTASSEFGASISNMDIFGVILDSNGNFPGCQYISDISITLANANLAESNLSLSTTTPNLLERTPGAASNITLPIGTTTLTEGVICSGGPSNEPDITVTPATVNFGNVNVGGTSDQTVTVKNDGSANLTIGTITSPGSPFSKITDNCSNKTLTPNQTCTLTYRFTPTSVNAFNGNSNIPSNDPDENPKTVTLTGNGVQATFAINLVSPSDGHEYWSCYTALPTFQWNKTGTFKSIELQFSSQNDFSSGLVKAKGSTATDELQVNSSTWKKVLLLPGKEGGTVYWRVVGKTSEGDEVKSNVFSIEIVEPRPVGDPYISSTSKSSTPTLYWANQCNTKFKAWFGNDSNFTKSGIKKKGLTFNDKNPFDYEGVFFQALTSGQWNSIKSLVGNAVGVPIYWYVEGWDGLGRHSQTDVVSFTLTP